MKTLAVIDATAPEGMGEGTVRQARALAGFLGGGFEPGSGAAHVAPDDVETLIFCTGDGDRRRLMDLAPTRAVRCVVLAARRPEEIADVLAHLAQGGEAGLFLFPPGPAGTELAARLARRTGGSLVSGALSVDPDADPPVARARVYSGHLIGRFALTALPVCVAVDASWQDASPAVPAEHEMAAAHVAPAADAERAAPAALEDLTFLPASGGDLAAARFVVAAGQGVGREGVARIAAAAARMGAAFAASRPVVMNAWAGMDRLVGISGTRTTPDVCLVAGASGAPAFLWGIEKAGFIAALNTDSDAPVVRAADVAVIDDGVAVLEALTDLLAAEDGE